LPVSADWGDFSGAAGVVDGDALAGAPIPTPAKPRLKAKRPIMINNPVNIRLLQSMANTSWHVSDEKILNQY
jgi:hypothetical protein